MLDSFSRPARLRYLSGSYQQTGPGSYVNCAVTGQRIPLASLRYWSHELQEPYADASAANSRYQAMRDKLHPTIDSAGA